MTSVFIKMHLLLSIFLTFYAVHREVASTASVQEYIVGGSRAGTDEFSYHVSLRYQKQHNCGGALITQRHVLTAAHCLVHFRPGGKYAGELDKFSVVVGTTNLFAPGQQYSVDAVYPHENYDNDRITDDIGIVKLAEEVTLSKFVSTASLPGATDLEPRTKLIMIGFGTYFTGDPVGGHHPISAVLRKVEVETVSLDRCQELWGDTAKIRETNICTSTDNDLGSCVGDSGGPLIYQGVIQGIVSYGEGYCADGVPDVATKVSAYLDWIDRTLKIPDVNRPKKPYFDWYLEPQNETSVTGTDLDETSLEIDSIQGWDIRIKKVKS